jgi:hypothetical protein
VEALQANYELKVTPPQTAQDGLHISVTFNGAKVDKAKATEAGGPLFTSFARFQAFQEQYLSTATEAIAKNDSYAGQWLSNIVELVKGVAAAWQSDAEVTSVTGSRVDTVLVPPVAWEFVLRVQDKTRPNVLLLTWTGLGSPAEGVWPTIEKATGQPTEINTRQYTLPPDANLLEFTLCWQKLSVISIPNITATSRTTRNEMLVGSGDKAQKSLTNPNFVYSTPAVTFPNPVTPLIEVDDPILIQANSINEAVNLVVTQVMQPTASASEVGWKLRVDYSFALIPGETGGIQTKLPILQTGIDTVTTASTSSDGKTVAEYAASLQDALKSWHEEFHPSDKNARLIFVLTLFGADGQRPLANLAEIELPISGPGWWGNPH